MKSIGAGTEVKTAIDTDAGSGSPEETGEIMKAVIGLLIVLLVGAGAYFYFTRVAHTPIGNILKDPREYDGKSLTIAGEVLDRTSLFVVKYFRVKDKTGEIVVISRRPLPSVGSKVRVTGRVQEAFSVGSEQMLVFIEDENGEVPKER